MKRKHSARILAKSPKVDKQRAKLLDEIIADEAVQKQSRRSRSQSMQISTEGREIGAKMFKSDKYNSSKVLGLLVEQLEENFSLSEAELIGQILQKMHLSKSDGLMGSGESCKETCGQGGSGHSAHI